jgi:hypothetical protein
MISARYLEVNGRNKAWVSGRMLVKPLGVAQTKLEMF